MYCPTCGIDHHAEPVAEPEPVVVVDDTVTPAEVEIARIQAERDVKLAKIQAGVTETVVEAENSHAEAKAEILDDLLTPEPEPEAEPVIVVDAEAEAAPEEPAEEAPPEVDDAEPAAAGNRRDHRSVWWG